MADIKLDPTEQVSTVSQGYRILLFLTAGLTFLLIAMGGIVCVTDSSQGCPDWPACYGRLIPPARLDSIIEYTHRTLAGLASLAIVASAVIGRRRYRDRPWISRPPMIALVFVLIVTVLGAMVVLRGLSPGWAAVDLGSALAVLALVLIPPVAAHSSGVRFSLDDDHARLAVGTLLGIWAVLVSAVLVADSGSVVRCLGWPLASARLLRGDLGGWLQLGRFTGGAAVALVVGALVVRIRREAGLGKLATATGLVLVAEILTGVAIAVVGSPLGLLVVYALMATALWALLVVLAARVTLRALA